MGLNKLKQLAGSVVNNFTINAAPGMDVNQLAQAVADKVAFQVEQKRAVW